MTFMTFYTPTYKRPTFLSVCRKSVQAQTCRDFQHMVIVDDAGIGVDGMFRDIRRHAGQIRGEYVYILADDDKLVDPAGLEMVRSFAVENNQPPVIIVKNFKWGQVFPLIWEQAPEYTKIDTGNFIIRADVFRETADQFGECYEGDWVYINHLWERGIPFTWLDYLFSGMQVGGKGLTEAEIMAKNLTKIRVRALKSFAARLGEQTWNIRRRQEFDMPAGVDWVQAGLVEVIETPAPAVSVETVETAALEPPERAVSKRQAAKKRKK